MNTMQAALSKAGLVTAERIERINTIEKEKQRKAALRLKREEREEQALESKLRWAAGLKPNLV